MFTYVGLALGGGLDRTELPKIDEIVSDIAAGRLPLRDGAPKTPDPIMRKFVLSRGEDENLMRRSHQRRVTAGRVFPGLTGAAMTVRERLQFGVKDALF